METIKPSKLPIIFGAIILVIVSLVVGFLAVQKIQNKPITNSTTNKSASQITTPNAMSSSCSKLYGIITASYGSPCKSDNYQAVADIDQDTYINGQDITKFREESSNGTKDLICQKYLSSKDDICAKHP